MGTLIEGQVDLPPDVVSALTERGPELGGHQALLLPAAVRGGGAFYLSDDLDGRACAQEAGLDAVFLYDGNQRRYLSENAAGWELQAAVAVAENLGADGIVALVAYLWHRVRRAKERGLYEGKEGSAPLKLTVGRVAKDGATGSATTSAVQLEGSLEEVCEAVRRLLGPKDG